MRYVTIQEYSQLNSLSERQVYNLIKEEKVLSYKINNSTLIKYNEKNDKAVCSVVSLVNSKGGVGKTTSAVHLSAYMSLCGLRVLLIDTDHQDNCRDFFNIKDVQCSLLDFFMKNKKLEDCITPTDILGLDIITNDSEMAFYVEDINNINMLSEAISEIRENYDFILLDNNPAFDRASKNSLVASDYVLIPAQANYLGFKGINALVEKVIQTIDTETTKILGIFATMYEGQTKVAQSHFSKFSEALSELFFSVSIPKDVRLVETPEVGKTIFTHAPRSRGAMAYKDLVLEMLCRIGEEDE